MSSKTRKVVLLLLAAVLAVGTVAPTLLALAGRQQF